jgi:hypothetical protein
MKPQKGRSQTCPTLPETFPSRDCEGAVLYPSVSRYRSFTAAHTLCRFLRVSARLVVEPFYRSIRR